MVQVSNLVTKSNLLLLPDSITSFYTYFHSDYIQNPISLESDAGSLLAEHERYQLWICWLRFLQKWPKHFLQVPKFGLQFLLQWPCSCWVLSTYNFHGSLWQWYLLSSAGWSVTLPGDLAAYPWHKECLEGKTAWNARGYVSGVELKTDSNIF